jgi:hypothetical protein
MSRRWIAVVLALAGASLLAIAVEAGHWWDVGLGVSIGPVSSVNCMNVGCTTGGLGWIGGSELWPRIGVATFAAGAIAAVVLVLLAGALAARRGGTLLAQLATVSVITALVVAVLFVALFPGLNGAEVGRGLWMYLAGAVAGIAATIVTRRLPPPVKPS